MAAKKLAKKHTAEKRVTPDVSDDVLKAIVNKYVSDADRRWEDGKAIAGAMLKDLREVRDAALRVKHAKRSRPQKFKGAHGEYLVIEEEQRGFFLYWFFPEDGELGGAIGEGAFDPDKMPEEHELKETWLAHKAALPYAMSIESNKPLEFESLADAKKALTAANHALVTAEIWPAWALEAKNAGWTPPPGWKP